MTDRELAHLFLSVALMGLANNESPGEISAGAMVTLYITPRLSLKTPRESSVGGVKLLGLLRWRI
jgi:hypothetical protein